MKQAGSEKTRTMPSKEISSTVRNSSFGTKNVRGTNCPNILNGVFGCTLMLPKYWIFAASHHIRSVAKWCRLLISCVPPTYILDYSTDHDYGMCPVLYEPDLRCKLLKFLVSLPYDYEYEYDCTLGMTNIFSLFWPTATKTRFDDREGLAAFRQGRD